MKIGILIRSVPTTSWRCVFTPADQCGVAPRTTLVRDFSRNLDWRSDKNRRSR